MMEVFDSQGRRYTEDEFNALRALIEEPGMRTIKDLEHFVLAEGETLILRCTRALSNEQLARMREVIEHHLPGRPVLVLPPDIEVMAGHLEVWGAQEAEPVDDIAAVEALRRAAVERAYNEGKQIWARDDMEIFQAHIIASSLPEFRWDEPGVNYGLTRKDVCD